MVSATTAHAWTDAMEYLIQCEGGKDFNIVIVITDPTKEIREVTKIVDGLAMQFDLKSTMENANAIWPSVFARPTRSAAQVFADIQRIAIPSIKSACRNRHDSYVERLLAWRSNEGGRPVPQLQNVLERLKSEVKNRAPKSSSYEISVYSPGLDAGYMSFPCLSHLSVKYEHKHKKLHLAAIYRNHTYLSHAYGNFIGLGRLMRFLCAETDTVPGELVSVSTHADAELSPGRKARVKVGVQQVRRILDVGDEKVETLEASIGG
jgi:thymidylate synthase